MKRDFAIGLYEKAMPNFLSLEEKLKFAKEIGFDYIELSIDETDEKLDRLNMSDKCIMILKEIMQKNDIRIGSICLSAHRKYPFGSSDEDTRKRSLDIMEKAIILAYKLGIPIIQLAGYDVYYEESTESTRGYFLSNLKYSVDFAAKYGIILAFETMETPFMDTVEKAKKYCDLINSPYLCIYPDIGNLTNASIIYKSSVENDIKLGIGKIVAAHLKETIPNVYREVLFNTGHVEFDKLINLIYSNGIKRFVIEMWYVGQDNWQDDIKFAYKFLLDKFK